MGLTNPGYFHANERRLPVFYMTHAEYAAIRTAAARRDHELYPMPDCIPAAVQPVVERNLREYGWLNGWTQTQITVEQFAIDRATKTPRLELIGNPAYGFYRNQTDQIMRKIRRTRAI